MQQQVADAVGGFVGPPPDLLFGELRQALQQAWEKALFQAGSPLPQAEFGESRLGGTVAVRPPRLRGGSSGGPSPLWLRFQSFLRHRTPPKGGSIPRPSTASKA